MILATAAKPSTRGQPALSRAGFTLIEVVLAVVIAVGMLTVVLYFYQQTAELRTQLLQETEQLAAARLLMDRIGGELRTARRDAAFEGAFQGGADSIQFIKTDLPSHAAWKGGALGRVVVVESDLKLVSYHLSGSATPTNFSAASPGPALTTTNSSVARDTGPNPPATSSPGTNIAGVARSEAVLLLARPSSAATESTPADGRAPRTPPLLTEAIHYLHFRYWDGAAWQESWNAKELPQGVEVSLGVEPMPIATDVTEYPYELFRRVILLAGSSPAKPRSTTPGSMPDPFSSEGVR